MLRPHLTASAVCAAIACAVAGTPASCAAARLKIALIMPAADSALSQPAQWAADGLIAANYASKAPAAIISVRPVQGASVIDQLNQAAKAGAVVAVGPLDRGGVEQLAAQPFLPIPVVTLNQVPLNNEIAETEIAPEPEPVALTPGAYAPEANRSVWQRARSEERPAPSGHILANTNVEGFVKAEDIPRKHIRKEPKRFPRELLMMGLSMENEAEYVTGLAVKALPERTASGEKPKVLLLDHATPLEKRISDAFLESLQQAGFAPDRMTVDHANLEPVHKMFSLTLTGKDARFPEELIDRKEDPVGYAQQQLRMKKYFAERRAEVAFAEPPYAAIFLAMGSETASLIYPRLPSRSRVWATSAIYPGDPNTEPEAKSMCYDLQNIGFAGSPFVLGYDRDSFEKRYGIMPISGVLQKRLFALGSDALKVAVEMAKGTTRYSFKGENGTISFDRDEAPAVSITPTPAMIGPGVIKLMKEKDLIEFNVIDLYGAPRQKKTAESAR